MPVSAPDGSAVLERGRPAPRGPAGESSKPASPAARPERPRAGSQAASSPTASEKSVAGHESGPRSVLEEEPPARRSIVEILGVWGFAVLVHVVVLLGLSFIVMPSNVREQIFSILGEASDEPDDAPIFEAIEMPEELTEVEETSEVSEVTSEEIAEETIDVPFDLNDLDPSMALEPADAGVAVTVNTSDPNAGRSSSAKAALVQKYGGNAASEEAVATGLKWLASRQRQDGSWNFNDVTGPPGQDEPGREPLDAPTGATAAALLAFLGAGHTHEDPGPYKKNVTAGLDYLLRMTQVTQAGADFRGAEKSKGMYVQGLAAIAFAEAYGMTEDAKLRRAAEAGILFIINAQSPVDGGWRYVPAFERRTPDVSDTSVVGWQLMALKSAQAAKVNISSRVFRGVNTYLDLASRDDGAQYGYVPTTAEQAARARPSMTAVGLLCRMYLGWDEKDKRLARGVEYLAQKGPNPNDSYYNYYATQVLHHWGGEKWDAWNAVQRDQLVNTQEKTGQFAGSWKPGGSHNDKSGGRLWVTCLSIMTLEVYYRHLPLYERGDIKVEF